jgi:hypothetical protein
VPDVCYYSWRFCSGLVLYAQQKSRKSLIKRPLIAITGELTLGDERKFVQIALPPALSSELVA